jgi:hypothetical protein
LRCTVPPGLYLLCELGVGAGRRRPRSWGTGTITLRKSECSKQASGSNVLAWDNGIGRAVRVSLVLGFAVMINRNSRGHSYSAARGEILGLAEDGLLRKHLPRMFSLIKNEGGGIEND